MDTGREELRDKFAEHSNIIGFVIVIFIYIGFSFFNGSISDENMFNNWTAIDWILFITYPLITAIIGSIAKAFLKKQGVRHGFQESEVSVVHRELLEIQSDGKEEEIPVSYEVYFIKGSIKGTIMAFVFSIGVSVLTTLMVLDFSLTNVLNMFVTLAVWIGLGINEYSLMHDYITTKHIVRMRYEIKKIKEIKNNDSERPDNRRDEISRRTDNEKCTGY